VTNRGVCMIYAAVDPAVNFETGKRTIWFFGPGKHYPVVNDSRSNNIEVAGLCACNSNVFALKPDMFCVQA